MTPTLDLQEFRVPIGIRSLKTANIYVISNGRHSFLVDTGMSPATMDFLKNNSIEVDNIDGILLTHLHFDHIGGAAFLQRNLSIPVNMGLKDAQVIWKMAEDPEGYMANEVKYLKYLGYPESDVEIAERVNPVKETYRMASGIEKITPVDESTTFAGFPEISILDVPGHTPGSVTYVIKNSNFAFTGDHVIEKITPNISYYDTDSDMLGLYMNSLIKLMDTGIQSGYAGHGANISNLNNRIEDILSHHKLRLMEIYAQCDQWLTPYEISGKIRWNRGRTLKEMNGMERIFALGETLAHLRNLDKIGLISKTERNGKLMYKK